MPDVKKLIEYIFTNMEDAVCITDKGGFLLHANPAAEKLLGFSCRAGEEKKIWEAIPYVEGNDALVQLFIDAVVNGTAARQRLVAYENAAGKEFMLRVSLQYTRDEGGLFIIIMNDLTEFLRVNSAFARYTSPQIAAYVLGSPDGEQPGGVLRQVTILMSDLRDFTGMTSDLQPGELVEITNHYFEKMVEVIEGRMGTVIEFLGDGIFAVFGAPGEDPKHAAHAVECAVEMQNHMPEVNAWNRERGYPELSMGIGINSGEAVIGNIGSPLKMKFGCMGDTVNMAGRTESLTVGGQICVTQATVSLIKEPLELAGEHSFLAKGKDGPMTIYDVRGIGNSLRLYPKEQLVWKAASGREAEIMLHHIEGKIVTAEGFPASVRQISADKRYALISAEKALKPLQNVVLETVTKDSVSRLTAKVIRQEGPDYVICFTSRPAGLDRWFRALTDGA